MGRQDDDHQWMLSLGGSTDDRVLDTINKRQESYIYKQMCNFSQYVKQL